MNTHATLRRTNRSDTRRSHDGPTPEARPAICLNLTHDDPVEGARSLIALQEKISPTLVIAGHGVQALWIFDTPVAPAQLEQLAEALAHAALTCGLRGSARVGEIVAAETVSVEQLRAALSEWLPGSYAREGKR